ncbi:MAG: ATP-binding protein [Candidatus Sedimenticola sp. 20ELBAFRAG]
MGQSGPCDFCTNDRLIDKNGNSTGVYVWEFQNTFDKQWYLCRDQAIRWPGGRMVRLEIATDITGLKRMERDLLESKRKAEEASLAKSMFLANMSHELRTPLNAILGFSEMVYRDAGLPDATRGKLEIINRSGEHLLAMVNDVLDLAKIEAGNIELETEVFDLPQLLDGIGRMFEGRAEQARLQFRLQRAPELSCYVSSDAGKLRQILINLLGNAVKFTPSGAVVLRASTQPLPERADMIQLSLVVEDSGIGIDKQQLPHIFEPFIQAGHSPAKAKGTGLGLAITRSFVESLDGSIVLDSELGKGTRVEVTLPMALADADAMIEPRAPRVKVLGLAPGQPAWRVLVVEDDLENRLLLTELLSTAGFELREAEDGRQAVELFEQWQPHLIWMDMRMPVMDGYEATRRIRQLPGGDKIKILALTASAFKEQHDKIINVGCNEVLHKPFRAEQIFEAMGAQLGVRYHYEEEEDEPSASEVTKLTPEMLATLPKDQRNALKAAMQSLRLKDIRAVMEQIRGQDADIANALEKLLAVYNYKEITVLMEKAEEMHIRRR